MITLLQNVSNSGVGGGDSDGSVGELSFCGEGCSASCRGGHGVGGHDVGDGVVVVVVVVVMMLVMLGVLLLVLVMFVVIVVVIVVVVAGGVVGGGSDGSGGGGGVGSISGIED